LDSFDFTLEEHGFSFLSLYLKFHVLEQDLGERMKMSKGGCKRSEIALAFPLRSRLTARACKSVWMML